MTEQMIEYERIIQARLRRHMAVVESACEAALQGGHHGVMVEWNSEVTRAWVSPDVPYGQVHERMIPREGRSK